jgi:site-specific DNA-methyltransferase (adenine-specific)
MGEIIVADCCSYMKTCADNTFDLIIADPPYFQICGEFDFVWKNLEEYLEWSKQWITECHRVLKPTGSFYLWGKIGFGKGYALFKIADWIENQKLFVVRNWITQRNSRGRGNKRGFMEAREELVYMTKTDQFTWNAVYTEEPSKRKDMGADGKPRKNSYKRCSDVWIDIAEASQSSKERFRLLSGEAFPTVKSQKLCDRIIVASSNKDDLIYIPFGGSGSEAVACDRNGRRWVLTELNQEYVGQIIRPRLLSA